MRMSIARRATGQMFFVTALTAASLSLCSFVLARAQLQKQVFSQLSSVVHNRKYLLEQHIQRDKERIALLGWQQEMAAMRGGSTGTQLLQDRLEALQAQQVPAMGIALFTTTGEKIAEAGELVMPMSESITATQVAAYTTQEGWATYSVYSPVRNSTGERIGVIGVQYNPEEFLRALLSAPGIGDTGEVVLGTKSGERISIVSGREKTGLQYGLDVGSFREGLQADIPIAGALSMSEGVTVGYDYDGRRVLAAYSGIPALDWGLVVKVEHDEAMRGVVSLSLIMVAISALLIALSAVIARVFARKLSEPIITLSEHMSQLGPQHWQMKRMLTTGDEVEFLESVAVDMARRLRRTYEHMEDEIADRTAELKEQYIKDRAILQSIDYGVVIISPNGVVTDANTAALDFLRCTKQVCTGKQAEDVLDIQVKHAKKKVLHPVTATLKTKKPVRSSPDMRFSIMRTDDILSPVMLSCVPLMDGQKLLGAILVFQDATEQRRVDYLKSEFISLASHQLRTPLSAIQWYIELFKDEKKISDTQQDYLNEMSFASHRMTGLIDALLHAARLETGDIEPQTSMVNVTELLAEMSDELRAMGKQKSIACTVKLPQKKMLVETDSVLLHVVFKNLFSNAIKYTEKNGAVGVAMKEVKNGVEITVSDTGIGIPKNEQKRLFERLFRASNVKKMDTDGNGLGLYITKMIIDSLGGEVKLNSVEKKGTQVVVTIPHTTKKTTKKKSA